MFVKLIKLWNCELGEECGELLNEVLKCFGSLSAWPQYYQLEGVVNKHAYVSQLHDAIYNERVLLLKGVVHVGGCEVAIVRRCRPIGIGLNLPGYSWQFREYEEDCGSQEVCRICGKCGHKKKKGQKGWCGNYSFMFVLIADDESYYLSIVH